MSRDFWVRESGAEVQLEWRIERFLSLSEEWDFDLHSPPFSLSDAQWFLEIWLNGWRDPVGWIHLDLCKRFFTSETYSVGYTLGIRSTDGTVLRSIDGEGEFVEHGVGGCQPLVRVSELRGSGNVLSADGVLTVFAILRLTKPTILHEDIRALPLRTTQTEEVSSEWKVEGFTSLSKRDNFSLKSPAFSFAGAEWCLRVFLHGSDDSCKEWVSLYLRRERSSYEEQTVAYTLGIRRRNGTPYRMYHGKEEFCTDDEWGCKKLIQSSELLDSPNGLVHQGSVTLFCTLRAERDSPTSSGLSYEERASQTTPSEGYEPSQPTSAMGPAPFSRGILDSWLAWIRRRYLS